MPKKQKAGKNSKTKNGVTEKRQLIQADLDGQVYGVLEKELGSRFFDVMCLDNTKRRCKIRQKRLKVKHGDYVIVSLRNFDDKNADVIYKYEEDEVRLLQKMGILPITDVSVSTESIRDTNEDDIIGFSFDDI
jgi:translation initiation factor 1A